MVRRASWATLAAVMLMTSVAAVDPLELAEQAVADATYGLSDEKGPAEILDPEPPTTAPPQEEPAPGLGDRLRGAFADKMMVAGAVSIAVALVGMAGFGLVTRYISPKEALKNPQRAMLYGFVKATPGAHLKQLSEEFSMKTSSILWHIRKLESADLVRSERANGFRVFYPVEGGVEVKRLSRAITALQNTNAQGIYQMVENRPSANVKQISERLSLHPGTVRWHLRKLREFGLVDELLSEDSASFYPTPLGGKALEAVIGKPVSGSKATPQPIPE